MARRSPMNARYQKNTGPAGKTRRSASAAKPKREAGGQAPAPAKKKGERPSFREALRGGPSTPEMKKWRRVWAVLIAVAFATALIAAFVPFVKTNRPLAMALIVIYLICLGGAFYVDLRIIRKLRAQATADAKAADKSKKK
ncbi:MAG TPA: hypothetical protein VGK50_01830 [Coriobacteriia bacterium]|jgi:hypothetical protein